MNLPEVDNYFISGRIFNDLCVEVKNIAARAVSNNNIWIAFSYKPSFYTDDVAKEGNRVAQYTIFLFTHAHKAARGVTVDKLFCYYFSVSEFVNQRNCFSKFTGRCSGGNLSQLRLSSCGRLKKYPIEILTFAPSVPRCIMHQENQNLRY